MGKVRTMERQGLDFCHLERAGREEYKSLYEFLFKTFVESDRDHKGAVTFQQFDVLIEDAAKAPRTLGLAPSTAQCYRSEAEKVAARRAEFDQMDFDRSGTVT